MTAASQDANTAASAQADPDANPVGTTHLTSEASAEAARDQLAQRLVDSAAPALELFSVHLGLELGLYRVLDEAATNPADRQSTPTMAGGLTEGDLAARAGIAARYAREWLEHQVVAGLLSCDNPALPAADRVYRLPPGHAEVLLDADSPYHTGPMATMLAGIARALPLLPDAFRTGGGVPYGAYGDEIREGIRALNRPGFIHDLASWIGAMPDVSNRLDRDPAARVLDLGCGEGTSTLALAAAYPRIRILGVDLDARSIAAAQTEAARVGLGNRVTFALADASRVSGEGPFDFATIFEALHDMGDPVGVLRAVRAGLADDGTLLVADELVADEFTAAPDEGERLQYGFSVLHCLPATMAEDPVEAAGTVLRAPTVHRWATAAGFAACTQLAVDNDFWRFYRMDRSAGA
ncbi:MAG TPA: class I SAM-dependent methyltransferase [Micromonosporaceae bacterium]|nr:class I SAM-dependent methyltransferase [Micromonosporaceae bacterium]